MAKQEGIFDALASNAEGLTVSELVGLLGASDSQVRRKLSALVAAGAVTTLKDDPAGPGRPTLRFRLAPTTSGWPELVRILVGVVGTSQDHEAAMLTLARQRGADMASGAFPHGVVDTMARLGFAPRDRSSRQDGRDDAYRVSFQSCPFRDAVTSEGGRAVCTLHRGLLEGMSEALGGTLEQFEPRDPIVAGCEARLRAAADR
jgi:predicted ArsR family transcriptional regulator